MSDSDFKLIKKEMDSIIKANLPITREEVSREEARLVGIFLLLYLLSLINI